ncbi:MAG: hypothetical protein Q9N67_03710 [Ghiorsea sp.]|nr:hypothetical protein [Ghiorsea sp.]
MIGKLEGKIEGKAEGKIEGVKQEKINIALKSLEQGLELETIKMITGLTDMELENLTNNVTT